MADKFFEEEKVEQQEQSDVIKLGEKEYSQEDLSRLVGLGEQALELESKWDTKIDRLMPEFSRSREELKALKEEAEARAREVIEKKEEKGEELSKEEQRKLVKAQLKEYGALTDEDFEDRYLQRRSAEKLVEQTESVISRAKADGKPEVDTESLFTYMKETGIRQPEVAYEVMFKDKLREIEMQKLQSIKPSPLYTQTGSTAGGKSPAPVSVTKDNLSQLLEDVLTRGGQ